MNLRMQIIVARKYGENLEMSVGQEDTIGDIKMRIYRITRITPSFQRLLYQGEELMMDDKTISDYNIQDRSIIHLSIWSTGYEAWREV